MHCTEAIVKLREHTAKELAAGVGTKIVASPVSVRVLRHCVAAVLCGTALNEPVFASDVDDSQREAVLHQVVLSLLSF